VFITGGGTGGHVLPNLPIISLLRRNGWKVYYIGSADGIESEIIPPAGVEFFPIGCGKFRRHWSTKHLTDPFRLVFGFTQALILFRELRPHVVFSKGGYVSVPVIIAAWVYGVPVVVHESDISPGLANRFAARFAKVVCVTFEETAKLFGQKKGCRVLVTGMPMRENISRGDSDEGRMLCGFDKISPTLLIMGGSMGSARINKTVEAVLPSLTSHFQVVHLTGKGRHSNIGRYDGRYKQFEFTKELQHLLAMSDFVVSRAGATSILELLAAKKVNVLLPISKASRGEQIENADYCKKKGVSYIIDEQNLSPEALLNAISTIFAQRQKYLTAINSLNICDGTEEICRLITRLATSESKYYAVGI
jgi:UDP-N-acetylglucosamine--N-acetylmuramyl-(pentapeptide) pyrophosphoryl-undecaprenol N-acetylglucosamine transferase